MPRAHKGRGYSLPRVAFIVTGFIRGQWVSRDKKTNAHTYATPCSLVVKTTADSMLQTSTVVIKKKYSWGTMIGACSWRSLHLTESNQP